MSLQREGKPGVDWAADLLQHFDDGDLTSRDVEISSHFKTNNACPYNDKLFRNFLQLQNFAAGKHRAVSNAACNAGDIGNDGFGTGRKQYFFCAEGASAAQNSEPMLRPA